MSWRKSSASTDMAAAGYGSVSTVVVRRPSTPSRNASRTALVFVVDMDSPDPRTLSTSRSVHRPVGAGGDETCDEDGVAADGAATSATTSGSTASRALALARRVGTRSP